MDYEKVMGLFAAAICFGAVAILLFMWVLTAANGNISELRINDYGEAGLEIIILVLLLYVSGRNLKKTIVEYING